jgi:aminoglycoside 6'-N-acetyltransferase
VTPTALQGSRVRLRPTGPGDVDALARIRATPEVRARWHGDDLVAEVAAELADPDTTMLTVEDASGRVVGLVQYAEEDDPDYRHASLDLYVDPAVHRRGYGSDAVATLVRHLVRDRGHHRLTIDPAADNAPAIACYASVGFRPVGVMRAYERQPDGTWADGLLMELLASDLPPDA